MQDFRCKKCHRLLAKVTGDALVEIKCPRCKEMNLYSQDIYITIDEEEVKDNRCTDLGIAES